VELAKFQEALQCYDRVLTINPDDAGAWFNKGVALYELKLYAEARQALQKAADLGHPRARQALDIVSKEGH
jgi:tetratricopeptide (TPR) repeat protein